MSQSLKSSFLVLVVASSLWIGCDNKKETGSAASVEEPTCEQAMQHAADLVIASMPESARAQGKEQIAAQMPTQVATCKNEKFSLEKRKCLVAAKSNEEIDKCP